MQSPRITNWKIIQYQEWLNSLAINQPIIPNTQESDISFSQGLDIQFNY